VDNAYNQLCAASSGGLVLARDRVGRMASIREATGRAARRRARGLRFSMLVKGRESRMVSLKVRMMTMKEPHPVADLEERQ
jgi:hypothetical protein